MSINVSNNRRPIVLAPVAPQGDSMAGVKDGAKSAAGATVRSAREASSFEPVHTVKQPKTEKPVQPAPAAEAPKKKGFFARLGNAIGSFVAGVGGAAVGVVKNLGEAAGTFGGGIAKLFSGKFVDGLKQMGQGLVKVVQTPVDAVIMVGGKALSGVQMAIGVEPAGRKLLDSEIAELRKVYGDTVDYSKIEVKEGDSGLLSKSGRAFVLGNTIYMPQMPIDMETLVHETGHVWQFQTGGTDYLSEALYAQFFGDAYQWEKGIGDGKCWAQLDPEQQAQLISDAYGKGFFDSPNARFISNGTDYTDYLRAAMAEQRAGRGAP